MKSKANIIALIVVSCLAAIGGTLFGWTTAYDSIRSNPHVLIGEPSGNFSQLDIVSSFIKLDSLYAKSTKEIETGAIKGMLSSLDPYSEYLDRKESEEFEDLAAGKYIGLGISLENKNDYFLVTQVHESSPAAHGGIVRGDKIIKINGKLMTGTSFSEIVKNIRGEEGTMASLTILHERSSVTETIDIIMGKVQTHPVSIKTEDAIIPVVRIAFFSAGTAAELARELGKTVTDKTKGIIIDLTGNPGGSLAEAVMTISLFLPENLNVVSVKGRNPDYDGEHHSIQVADFYDKLSADVRRRLLSLPLVIITDEWSASAAEIFSAALRDHGRAKIIGKKTYGKGTVQRVFSVGGGALIKMTIAKYFTPKGISVDKDGITPDLEIKGSEESIKQAKLFLRGGKILLLTLDRITSIR